MTAPESPDACIGLRVVMVEQTVLLPAGSTGTTWRVDATWKRGVWVRIDATGKAVYRLWKRMESVE